MFPGRMSELPEDESAVPRFPSSAEHLLILFTAGSGILFLMLSLRDHHLRESFGYFHPGRITYWAGLLKNLSVLVAPAFLVFGGVIMSNRPDKGWPLFFAGTAFHAFTALFSLRFLLFTLIRNTGGITFFFLLYFACSALCAFMAGWLLTRRIRGFVSPRKMVLTLSLTAAWFFVLLLAYMSEMFMLSF